MNPIIETIRQNQALYILFALQALDIVSVRHDLFTHRAFDLLAAPAITQCYRNGPFRIMLTDNIFIKFADDLMRSEDFKRILWLFYFFGL